MISCSAVRAVQALQAILWKSRNQSMGGTETFFSKNNNNFPIDLILEFDRILIKSSIYANK
jgi:hypothetical protein